MPGAAPFGRQVLAQVRMESRLLLRNGEQLLLALVIPVVVLFGGVMGIDRLNLSLSHSPIDELSPGVLALAVMSTSFTALAIATGFERRYGVLKRLGASPLPRSGLLLGKVAGLLVIEAIQLALICLVGLALGWQPAGGGPAVLEAAALIILGTAAFAGLGMLMAGTLRAEATLAAANLVYVVLLAAGAVVVPLAKYPQWMHPVVAGLPSGALAEGLRSATSGGGARPAQFAVLAVWAMVAAALAMRTFRWE